MSAGMLRFSLVFAWAFLGTVLVAASSAQENWPQFRGADSLGVADNSNLPDTWSATENVAWKTDLKGRGWSSPIVWGERIFLTSVVNLGEAEEPKKGLYFGGNRPKPPESEHQWKVVCLDLDDGRVLWEQLAHQGIPATPIHLKNSYASETPVTDGERVYAYFGNVGLFCYDLDGKLLWSHLIEPHKMRYGWGTAASPVVHEGRVYVVNDNDEESYLLALDARTGEQIFRVERDEKSNWATPFIWENSQRTELVIPATGMNRSYDLEGRLLWELGGMSSITIATPYADGDTLYLSSGYVLDKKKPIYAVRPGASGDISLADGETSNEYVIWSKEGAGPYNPSTLLYKGQLYVLYDQGFFASFDAQTGEEVYSKKRIPDGKAFTASPWAYNNRVFCLNEDGVTFVIAAGKDFEILHTNTLAEDDMCMSTPAIVGDKLIIRTSARVYCIQKKS
ncbi:MAG: serine/threonine protein kinase [Planctomycetota bacterium]|nr:MAG: serine/threonine protein kinase [Planctomycetota bacterium]